MDLEECFANWKKHLQQREYSSNTISAYIADLEHFFNFLQQHFQSKIDFSFLDQMKIQDFRAWLSDLSITQSAVSRARSLSSVKHFFNFAIELKLLQNNVISCVKFPKKSKKLPKFIPDEVVKEIIEFLIKDGKKSWIGLRNATIVSLLYGSGMRISEVINLQLDDIDFSQQEIHILHAKGNKERIVPILQYGVDLLQQYLKICPFSQKKIVFFGVQGKKLCTRHFAKILQKINFNFNHYFSSHTFRHSCATHLLANKVDLRQIQELLGHESLSSTQIYADVQQKDLFLTYKKNFL